MPKFKLLCLSAIVIMVSHYFAIADEKDSPKTYMLYSWQDNDKTWNFSIFSGSNSGLLPIETVTNQKTAIHGITQLKNRLSEIPKDSKILWLLSKGTVYKDDKKLIKYPDKSTIDEIDKYAKSVGLYLIQP